MTYPISDVTRRVIYTGSAGVGPYPFSFEVLDQGDIGVYFNDTLLTITTDYTVTVNADGTGSITLITSTGVPTIPDGDDTVAIYGRKGIARSTDFVTGGDLFASSLNDELDAQTIFAQQNAEGILRSLRGPVTDPTSLNMELPSVDNRKGYFLHFDSTTGAPDVSLGDATMQIVAGKITEVELVADDLSGATLGTGRIYDLGAITDSAGTLSAAPNGYIVTVYNNLADVNAVAADITDVAAVGADLLGADNIGTVATDLNGADNIGTVGADIANVNLVGTNITDVVSVATALTSVPSGASLVTYDNATSGLTATDVQAALDELVSAAVNAINVAYNNASSGLTATDVQAAIDEINTAVGALPTLSGTNTFSGPTTFNNNVTINGTMNAGSI